MTSTKTERFGSRWNDEPIPQNSNLKMEKTRINAMFGCRWIASFAESYKKGRSGW